MVRPLMHCQPRRIRHVHLQADLVQQNMHWGMISEGKVDLAPYQAVIMSAR
jgi:hypothetical protein